MVLDFAKAKPVVGEHKHCLNCSKVITDLERDVCQDCIDKHLKEHAKTE